VNYCAKIVQIQIFIIKQKINEKRSLKNIGRTLTNGGIRRCLKGSFVKKKILRWVWATIMGHRGRKWDFLVSSSEHA